MNKELFEQIATQADEYFEDITIEFSRQAWVDKFAELIVRECMKVTKDYTCNQGWDYSAPVALARHFGVEE